MRDGRRFDLTRLLGPVSPARFFREYWEEKPLLVSRRDPDYYGALLTLAETEPLITVLPPDSVTLANEAHSLEVAEYARADGSLDVVKAFQLFAEGATIVIDHVHKRLEKVAACCRNLEREIGAPVHCNLYLTPSGGTGFGTHYDTHDVLLLQLAGSKQWTIFDSPVRLPLSGQPFNPNLHAVGPIAMSVQLKAGDLLYIPRGFLHSAQSRDETSLHATLGVKPYRWADAIMETMAQLCLSDPAFRRSLPAGLGRPDFDIGVARSVLADLLARALEEAKPDAALDRIVDSFVSDRRAFVPGQLAQAQLSKELTPGNMVGARPEAIYRLHPDGNYIRIKSQGREVTLPAESAAALAFALENGRYRVRDLPGELDDDDKVALVTCLINEGLVWRLPDRGVRDKADRVPRR